MVQLLLEKAMVVWKSGWWSAEKELLPCFPPSGHQLGSLLVETTQNHSCPRNPHAQPPRHWKEWGQPSL